MRMLVLVGLAALTGLAFATRPEGTTLRSYIDSMHWDAAKSGPLLVLEPDLVVAKDGPLSLSAFGRKKVVVRGLSAFVPSTMVIIDDSFRQSPNLYDGLPLDGKVMYLLSTLDPGQWKTISGGGIGLNDLNDDQKAVFKSILPKPFGWSSIEKKPGDDVDVSKHKLSEEERLKVRLRVRKSLLFEVNLRDERGIIQVPTNDDFGETGLVVSERDDSAEFNVSEVYGVKIRQVVDNVRKASEIVYASGSFDAVVKPAAGETVGELLQRIGEAVGRQLVADIRVKDRVVFTIGKEARAGDLLEALALAVTGTYRNVGGVYELVSDLEGLGARKLKLALWEQAVQEATFRKMNEWRKAIAASGGVASLKFDSDDPLAPNDAIQKCLDSGASGPRQTINGTDITPALRSFLERHQKAYSAQPFTTEGMGVQAEYLVGFVLPNGTKLKSERQQLFLPGAPADGSGTGPVVPKADLPFKLKAENGPFGLWLKTDNVAQAASAVAAAAEHGFGELWLETQSEAVLKEAIRAAQDAKVSVHLVVRPFAGGAGTALAEADFTILGDTAETLARRNDVWPAISKSMWEMTAAGLPAGYIVPTSAGNAGRFGAFAALAQVPGLGGVGVLDTDPRGYQPARNRGWYANYSATMYATQAFGYGLPMRKAFLRANFVDPVDLVPPDVWFNGELRQPFFSDDALRGATIYDGVDTFFALMGPFAGKWDEYRTQANARASEEFLGSLAGAVGDLPMLVSARRADRREPLGMDYLFAWKAGMKLSDIELGMETISRHRSDAELFLFTQLADKKSIAAAQFQHMIEAAGHRVIDCTGLAAKDWKKTLDVWFAAAP